MLGLLSYLKTLDGFEKHKPIISLSAETFQDYMDYFIIDGLVYLIGIQSVFEPTTNAIYTLTIMNPHNIKAVFSDQLLNADVTAVVDDVPIGDWDGTIKSIVDGASKGTKNYGIPYTSVKICVEGRVFMTNDTFKCTDKLFQIDNPMYDASSFSNVGKQGEVYKNIRFISAFDKAEAVTVPLTGVFRTPFVDYISEEIKEYVKNYLKSLNILNGTPWKKNRSYHKGEHIWVNVETKNNNNEITNSVTKYYVSKIEGNHSLPTESDSWIEIEKEF